MASTGQELLRESADVLEAAADACEHPEDAARFSDIAARIRAYLASSRPTTPIGMPQIASSPSHLSEEMVVHPANRPSHIRIVRP